MSITQRLSAAMSPAAMILAIFALVVSAAGAGYAAGKIGTNDLQDNCTSAQILASYGPAFRRLHAAGLKVYVVATTPRPIYNDQMNQFRWDVDTFTMNRNTCSGTCDGVIDFSQVIEQPLNPTAINLAYDNGDGIHVNIAGQRAESDTVNLPMLVASARHTH